MKKTNTFFLLWSKSEIMKVMKNAEIVLHVYTFFAAYAYLCFLIILSS